MVVSSQIFKDLLAQWASGVAIVTTRVDGNIHGMTITSFTSVSVEPPLILICTFRGTRTRDLIARGQRFAVNILTEEQQELARRFAGQRPPAESPFTGVTWTHGRVGCPLLEGCAAYLECTVKSMYEAGTHTIFIGQVETGYCRETARPLIYWNRDFRGLTVPVAKPATHSDHLLRG